MRPAGARPPPGLWRLGDGAWGGGPGGGWGATCPIVLK